MVVYVTQESTNANPIQKIVLKLIQQAFKIRRNNMFPKGVYVSLCQKNPQKRVRYKEINIGYMDD